ncbi:PUF nine target 1 [Novymonas esmeraldas]|uniref:PUF nine target 1 n=1 Tax=Novymonas esmeraldas TaxID=1808958 RepID=A0AAW0EI63_9TRYP
MPPKRCPNRLLVLCASINDVTAWPFWKFLQMKKIRGVTDMAMLAFNSDGGSFEARIDGDRYHLKNFAKVRGYQHEMFESFVHRWHDPGRSYFVYGGHGMGDYMELEQDRVSLQAHELAAVFGTRTFEAVLFDACFMSNIDCAYHLRHNTRYIGACEGYMWEPDTALDYHVFNTHNASAMSRFKDPLHILRVIQADYCSKAARGDFAILDTTHAAELRQFVQEHVVQRAYDRATLYSLPQQDRLQRMAEASLQAAIAEHGHPGGDANVMDSAGGSSRVGRPRTAPSSPELLALATAGRPTRRQRVLQAIQFEHSLYPSEVEDKQLLDLKSYLTDMLLEERQREAWEAAALGPQRRIAAGRRRVRRDGGTAASSASPSSSSSFAVWTPPPSRALSVDRHGRLPAAAPALGTPFPVTAPAGDAAISRDSSQSASTTVSPASLSPSYKGSAQEGLDLLHKVVVSHVPPKAAAIYAAQLGGLSFTMHEYSPMSRPTEPWVVESKRLLRRRAKQYLRDGELSEVVLTSPLTSACDTGEAVLAAVDRASAAVAAAAASATSASGTNSGAVAPPLTTAAAAAAASVHPSHARAGAVSDVAAAPRASALPPASSSGYSSSSVSSGSGSGNGSNAGSGAVTPAAPPPRAASCPPPTQTQRQTTAC